MITAQCSICDANALKIIKTYRCYDVVDNNIYYLILQVLSTRKLKEALMPCQQCNISVVAAKSFVGNELIKAESTIKIVKFKIS
jgi:hypothetical protein